MNVQKEVTKQLKAASKRRSKSLVLSPTQMIALRNIAFICSKEKPNIKPLISLLSTIYAELGVTKGFAAILKDKTSRTPILLEREHMNLLITDIWEAIWKLESIVLEACEALQTGQIEK